MKQHKRRYATTACPQDSCVPLAASNKFQILCPHTQVAPSILPCGRQDLKAGLAGHPSHPSATLPPPPLTSAPPVSLLTPYALLQIWATLPSNLAEEAVLPAADHSVHEQARDAGHLPGPGCQSPQHLLPVCRRQL